MGTFESPDENFSNWSLFQENFLKILCLLQTLPRCLSTEQMKLSL